MTLVRKIFIPLMARPITKKGSRDHEASLARAWAILIQASFSAVKFIQKQVDSEHFMMYWGVGFRRTKIYNAI